MELKAKTNARARLCSWLVVGLLVTSFGASVQSHAQRTPPLNRYKHDYEFTADWFWPSVRKWELLLAEFKGQPNLSYLEVGPFEGRSFYWVLDNILTHPSTRATAIDVFETGSSAYYLGDFEARFRKNARISGREKDITIIKGYSKEALRPPFPSTPSI